jgi:hypothetical protein
MRQGYTFVGRLLLAWASASSFTTCRDFDVGTGNPVGGTGGGEAGSNHSPDDSSEMFGGSAADRVEGGARNSATQGGGSDGGSPPNEVAPPAGGSHLGGSVSQGEAGGDVVTVTGPVAGASTAAGTAPVGDPGAAVGAPEAALVPACTFLSSFAPERVMALASAMVVNESAPQVFSSDLATETTLVRWRAQAATDSWVVWRCFDQLPKTRRLAAMNLPNGHPELFATNSDGYLFVRRSNAIAWTPWVLFTPPTREAFIEDIAALGGAYPSVYVIADGRVYGRSKADPEAYADYGPWRAFAANDARLLAASTDSSGGRRVFVVTEAGEIQTAAQVSGDVSGGFEAWSVVDTEGDELVDLDAIPTEGGTLLYTLSSSGVVKVGSYAQGDITWQQLRDAVVPPRFVALTALLRPQGTSVVVGVSEIGELFQLESDRSWTLAGPL